MSKPIVLWNTRARQTATSDDAGVSIVKSVLASVNIPGPYEGISTSTYRYVPPLTCLCIRRLLDSPDQIHFLDHIRLLYRKASGTQAFDILQALLPSDGPDSDFALTKVDPRLWAVLIQIYSHLPSQLDTYIIPLSDKHVPLLQRVPSTPHFTLITVLDLPGCSELTDTTIVVLKHLYGLCALDASGTTLSNDGIKTLSGTLIYKEGDVERKGPWGLRILGLRNCRSIDNGVFKHLMAFLLLTVVDLRGSRCLPDGSISGGFLPATNSKLFYPSPMSTTLSLLSSSSSSIFSSNQIFTLYINTLFHRKPHLNKRATPSVTMEDTYVVLPSIKQEPGEECSRQKIKVGNAHALQREMEWEVEVARHEKNREAWYVRNADRLEMVQGVADPSEAQSNSREYSRAITSQASSSSQVRAIPYSYPKRLAGNSSSRVRNTLNFNGRSSTLQNSSLPLPQPSGDRRASAVGSHFPPTSESLGPPSLSVLLPPPLCLHRRSPRPGSPVAVPSTTPLHLGLLPGPPSSVLDLHNAIAEAELREHTSRQNADSFYCAPRSRSTRHHRNPQAYRPHATSNDTRLMLFRDPPPWNALGSFVENLTKRGNEGPSRAQEDKAILNRSSATAKTGMDGVMEMMQRRMVLAAGKKARSSQPTSRLEGAMLAVSSITTNPFARKCEPPTSYHEISTTSSTSAKSVVGDLAKPLKPISFLAGPPPPESIRKKRKPLNTSKPKQDITMSKNPVVSLPRSQSKYLKMDFKGTPSGRSSQSHTNRITKASDAKPNSDKKGQEKVGGEFDWNKWVTK